MSIFGQKNIINASFGHTIYKGSSRPKHHFEEETPSNRWVILLCLCAIFVIAGLVRLVDLQIISGNYYRSLAEGNRIRRIPIKAPRGEILDRNNVPLARNVPVYKLATFTPGGVVKETQIISREEAITLQSSNTEDSNRLLIDVGREYPLAAAGAHIVGYVNESSEKEIGIDPGCNSGKYQLEDLVGRSGIEAYYECHLKGTNGEELIEVDARGKLVRKLGRREPIPGKSLKLAIDANLQRASYEALLAAPDEKGIGPRRDMGLTVNGAVIAQNPQNGEVLALVSVPSFDPSLLKDKYGEYLKDENLPFFNRAIGGSYHPGSTFKIVTSTAALETGKINKDFKYDDPGIVKVGDFSYRNWYYTKAGKTEGVIDLVRAIARSTDTFFYIVGEQVGIKAISEWATAYNLGRKTGIDLPGEEEGLVPTPEWKLKTTGERWFLGNTYHVSIGQGDLTTTPLQVNGIASIVAARGKSCKPKLSLDVKTECREMGIKPENLDLVEEGMLAACAPGGTAGVFFNSKPTTACKTGTAQFSGDKTHAWFMSYAPAASDSASVTPEISVTALVEGGGEGSIVAAPVVKKIIEEYFRE